MASTSDVVVVLPDDPVMPTTVRAGNRSTTARASRPSASRVSGTTIVGADVGRVLVGLQVPRREQAGFRRFLRELGYDYTDESRNPAYRLFLA